MAQVDGVRVGDVAEQLVSSVEAPITVSTPHGSAVVRVGASIGAALAGGLGGLGHGGDAEALIARADAAAYRAKHAGRGRVELHGGAPGGGAGDVASSGRTRAEA